LRSLEFSIEFESIGRRDVQKIIRGAKLRRSMRGRRLITLVKGGRTSDLVVLVPTYIFRFHDMGIHWLLFSPFQTLRYLPSSAFPISLEPSTSALPFGRRFSDNHLPFIGRTHFTTYLQPLFD